MAVRDFIIERNQMGHIPVRIAFVLCLGAVFLNPVTERIEFTNAIPFMFSHYAIFVIGLLLSYRLFRLPPWLAAIGSSIAVFWHLPYTFLLSGVNPFYRIVEELSLGIGGWLVGSSLRWMKSPFKSAMLVIWFVSDTALSILFIISPTLYSRAGGPNSPYLPSQFIILGIAMIFFMNGVIAYIVYQYLRRYRSVLLSEDS